MDCRWVPAHVPRNFWEALQAYWFTHLGVVTELNTWDSFCPGHLDQHLLPFYKQGIEDGSLTRETATELLAMLVGEVQQSACASEGRRHGGGERDLHRLRQHQQRRTDPGWRRRASTTSPI